GQRNGRADGDGAALRRAPVTAAARAAGTVRAARPLGPGLAVRVLAVRVLRTAAGHGIGRGATGAGQILVGAGLSVSRCGRRYRPAREGAVVPSHVSNSPCGRSGETTPASAVGRQP